ncbi:kinase-like domain-containing protein [Auriculariales sp. MPI-PUGE-AT-0066]|nr:kinase-like domain-containing protein [Auriculariales sp. MPI-PUGE-AT-0066]
MVRQTWPERRERIRQLLRIPSENDVDEDGEAWLLDDLVWNPASRPDNREELDKLAFGDRDLNPLGTIAKGQFGLVDVVRCKIDERLYARKVVEKRLALRAREQCHPQVERDILLLARSRNTEWVPHLLCAFQSSEKLSLVMTYADSGSLWDIVESLADGACLPESDLLWWMPQAVCGIEWCHSQGFAHRDIKPHNFVFDSSKRLRLIDFGSAAKLLPPARDGVQLVPKRECLVPCGTCDYISPEVLGAHEEALVECETDDRDDTVQYDPNVGGYGKETDWWSFGAMFYELAFGIAPFYAKDVRRTYTKIIDHENNLVFPRTSQVSSSYVGFLKSLLCHHDARLGRRRSQPVQSHPYFKRIKWQALHKEQPPRSLHLPHYSSVPQPLAPDTSINDEGLSREIAEGKTAQPFDFSALFQSTMMSPSFAIGHSRSVNASMAAGKAQRPVEISNNESAFIGFSWGPEVNHFNRKPLPGPATPAFVNATPARRSTAAPHSDPLPSVAAFVTPMRGMTMSPAAATIPRSAMRRGLSDREALRQLVGCVTVSARKRVLQSGRTPRLPVLRGVAFRNSDDGGSVSGTNESETEDERPLPPSPSPSPRPSSRVSNRMTMMSDSMSSRSRAQTPDSRELTPPRSRSQNTTPTLEASVRVPTEVTARFPRRPLEIDDRFGEKEAALNLKLAEMGERHAALMKRISDLEQQLRQAK